MYKIAKYLIGFIIWIGLGYAMLVQFNIYLLLIIELIIITIIINYRIKHNYD